MGLDWIGLHLPQYASRMSSDMANEDAKGHWYETGQNLKPSDLPSHLLRAAYLVGKTPFRACRSDSRILYTLYIPEAYCRVHKALQDPDSEGLPERLQLLVNVHGTRRDAITCRDSLIKYADIHGIAILAPLFPAGLDSPFDLDSYKNLRSKTLQSDLRLLDILNEVNHIWPGISTDPIMLMGFSGGAQFCHRFMYLYPERVASIVIAAPGRTTKLNNEPWPLGIGNVGEVFPDQDIEISTIRQIPAILLAVGEEDQMSEDTKELQAWLSSRTGVVSSEREPSRVHTLKSFQHHWEKKGIQSELVITPGVGHDYGAILPAILKWLEENISLD